MCIFKPHTNIYCTNFDKLIWVDGMGYWSSGAHTKKIKLRHSNTADCLYEERHTAIFLNEFYQIAMSGWADQLLAQIQKNENTDTEKKWNCEYSDNVQKNYFVIISANCYK